jgi:hypothetical protein
VATNAKPIGVIDIPPCEHREDVERWFEDLFTRGDLRAVDELVSVDFVAFGTGSDNRTVETRVPVAFREWLRANL